MSDVLDTMIGASEVQADPETARKHYKEARAAQAEGDRVRAIELMRDAARLSDDAEYTFQLAYLLDLSGEEADAIGLYEQLCSGPRPHINALMNLAVLYEDRGEINRAERCLKQVLDTDPNHARARMFLKDVQASRDMFYEEENFRDSAKRNAMLDTPVTDFELTVRARNCLKKMQIRTLGDLLKVTEAELMSYKNFGENSLVEIKQMLSQRGLRLGQGADSPYSRARKEIYEELRGQASDSVLNKPISALDLSVRARKALQALNIQTIGDLASRTEAELMGVKNFGQTSLEEVKEKLGGFNLSLRTLD